MTEFNENPKRPKLDFAELEVKQEWINEKESSNTKSESEFEEDHNLGIPCDENKTHIAVLYCLKCEANFCKTCSILTHSSNVLASHQMVKVTEELQPILHCPQHSQFIAEFFCEDENCDDENKLICQFCQIQGAHKDHKKETTAKAHECKKANIIKKLEEINSKKEDLLKFRENFIEIDASYDKQKAENFAITIKEAFANYKKQIEISEQAAIANLHNVFDNNRRLCGDQMLSVNSTLEQIKVFEKRSELMMNYTLADFFKNCEALNALTPELPLFSEPCSNSSKIVPIVGKIKIPKFELTEIKTIFVIGDTQECCNMIKEALMKVNEFEYIGSMLKCKESYVRLLDSTEFEKINIIPLKSLSLIYATDENTKQGIAKVVWEIQKIQKIRRSYDDKLLLATNDNYYHRKWKFCFINNSDYAYHVHYYKNDDAASIARLVEFFV